MLYCKFSNGHCMGKELNTNVCKIRQDKATASPEGGA